MNRTESPAAVARSDPVWAETDGDDVSSVASSDTDDLDAHYDLAPRTNRLARRQRQGLMRRGPRRLTGRERADQFIVTARLMGEVEALRRRRDELMALRYAYTLNTGRRDIVTNTAIQYYDTFRDGFSGPRIPEMIQYFNTRLDHEIFSYGAAGDMGVDTWIEQWRRYTRMFPSISIKLRSLDMVNLADSMEQLTIAEQDRTMVTSIVEARGMMGGVITRQAVCTVCPHLRGRESLIRKLDGKPLKCPMELRFHFNATGRVTRLDFFADYFTAFSNVDGVSISELAEIMEHAAIGENSTVPDPIELDVDDIPLCP